MQKLTSIFFAIVILAVSYKIIEPWLLQEPEPEKPKKHKTIATSTSSVRDSSGTQAPSSDLYIQERLAEKMPKLYSWQRLLQLHGASHPEAFNNYVDEWLNANSEQLYKRAFRRGYDLANSQVQQHIIQRTVYNFPEQAEELSKSFLVRGYDEHLALQLALGFYQYHPDKLQDYLDNEPAFAKIPNDFSDLFIRNVFLHNPEQALKWLPTVPKFSQIEAYKEYANAQLRLQNPETE
ncbi:hypothetical protein [Catenovulum sediminis]|uniref:Uncharacterized protein n=1 Tax=Catenovulum sediminis TaxID=1740262 RepID=A0ABV1RMN4_9ALTE